MRLVLEDEERDLAVELEPDPETIIENAEGGATALYYELGDKINTLEELQERDDKDELEELKEQERYRVERERGQGQELWAQDPGINSPQDYA